jgi:BlaI family transcriptional regulator, penicillinase repressor
MQRIKPTAAEWEICNTLWRIGPSTVRGVYEAMNIPTGYTTTLKLMQIMADKGLLRRDESARAHVYSMAFEREALQADAAEDLLDRVFGGSASQLMQRALSRRKPDRGELTRLRQLVEQFEKGK